MNIRSHIIMYARVQGCNDNIHFFSDEFGPVVRRIRSIPIRHSVCPAGIDGPERSHSTADTIYALACKPVDLPPPPPPLPLSFHNNNLRLSYYYYCHYCYCNIIPAIGVLNVWTSSERTVFSHAYIVDIRLLSSMLIS